jgi:molybdopterin/thiamine biosynthesis adenylyltransferase
LYLAASGVGHITIADHDVVDLTNLQRQIAHTTARVGQPKVDSASQAMLALNPEVRVTALPHQLDATQLDALVPTVQVVVDCCDNFETRQAVNAACVKHQVPLVSGAAIRMDGQLSVYDARDDKSPCYACIFSPDEKFEEVSCSTMGIFSPLVGIIGAMQAAQALQVLIGFGDPLVGRMLLWNGRTTQIDEIRITRNADCLVCGKAHSKITKQLSN